MRHLSKKLTVTTDTFVRDGGKMRKLVITLYPGGTIGLRPAKTRREEFLTLDGCYERAIKVRVTRERVEKAKVKAARRKK